MAAFPPHLPPVHPAERDALTKLLSSGEFSRSINLEKILTYLCEKYFQGEGSQIKEFHVATEALGRPESFDPKKDSIVRVEMHRLRKRLKDYYENKAVDEPVQILIPEKSYIPLFVHRRVDAGVAQQDLAELALPLGVDQEAGAPLDAAEEAVSMQEEAEPPRLVASKPVLTTLPTAAAAGSNGAPQPNLASQSGLQTAGSLPTNANAVQASNPATAAVAVTTGTAQPLGSSATRSVATRHATSVSSNRAAPVVAATQPTSAARRKRILWVLAASAATVAGLIYYGAVINPASGPGASTAGAAEQGASAEANTKEALGLEPNGQELRILAGRPAGKQVDRFGLTWEGDRYFKGGTSFEVRKDVGTMGLDNNLFAGGREGNFRYEIPLAPGQYELTVYFAETAYGESNPLGGGEGHRIFDIYANNKPLFTGIDVLAEAGTPNLATARMAKGLSPGPNGKLVLDFRAASTGLPFVNAFMLRPGLQNRMRPIRIVSRPQSYQDSRGNRWEADHFYRGGVQITRPHGAPTTDNPDLFRGERYGNFSYIIPVPPGRYGARLYMWDYWWGPDHPGRGGVGSRVFDIFCNFRPLLENFDIIRHNTASQIAIHTFHGLEPNLEGKLVFSFVPKRNYAELNAIEVFDEGESISSK